MRERNGLEISKFEELEVATKQAQEMIREGNDNINELQAQVRNCCDGIRVTNAITCMCSMFV